MLIYLLHATFVVAPCTAQDWSAADGFEYTEDEVLNYGVYYKTGPLWFMLGEVSFVTCKSEGGTMLKVSAHTYPKWRRIHEFHSDFSSVLDSSGHLPLTHVRRSIEKGQSVFDSISFDQQGLKAEEWITNDVCDTVSYTHLTLPTTPYV